jgi:hypothetical protein
MPDGNKKAFNEAQEKLLALGHYPINPHNVCRDIVAMHEGTTEELWTKCMKRDITELLKADAVLLLPGWQNSKGACIERELAKNIGIPTVSGPHRLEIKLSVPNLVPITPDFTIVPRPAFTVAFNEMAKQIDAEMMSTLTPPDSKL